MFHLLIGPDRYRVDHRLLELLDVYDAERLNTTRFDRSADPGAIGGAVATAGFFGSGRVIVAEGLLAKASGQKPDVEPIVRLLGQVAAGNHLILVDADVRSVPKTLKEGLPVGSELFEGTSLFGNDLVRWAQEAADRYGSALDTATARHLLNRRFPGRWSQASQWQAPPDLATLDRELDKLVTYVDGQPITMPAIDAIVATDTSDQLFAFSDSVLAGNAQGALQQVLKEGLEDDAAAKLLGYAGTQAELALVVAASPRNENLKELGRDLNGASVSRLSRLQRSVNSPNATAFGQDVATADRRMKTGKVRGPLGQIHDLIRLRAKGEG